MVFKDKRPLFGGSIFYLIIKGLSHDLYLHDGLYLEVVCNTGSTENLILAEFVVSDESSVWRNR